MKKQHHIPVLNKYREIYFKHLTESVIPFWQKNSPDWEHGGTFSCLDRRGGVFDSKKYSWPVARSAWMFTRLYNEFDQKEEYLKIAELGIECLQCHARDEQGRYYFSLTREGDPWFYQRKPYGAVFAMMAYLAYFRACGTEPYRQEAICALVLAFCRTGETRWLDWLEKIHRYAFDHFVDAEYGGWFGYCDRQGNLTHASKGSHYKGFFHVPRALLFSIQEIDRYVAKG